MMKKEVENECNIVLNEKKEPKKIRNYIPKIRNYIPLMLVLAFCATVMVVFAWLNSVISI